MPESRSPTAPHRKQDLAGKVAIVTGGTRGIGRAITRHLAERGAAILVTSTSTGKNFEDLQNETRLAYANSKDGSPKIAHQVVSLEDLDAHIKISDAIQREFNGHVDIYVNNAAISDRTYPGQIEVATLDRLLMCNIRTPAMVVNELVKRQYFRKESRIVFISSAESVNCEPAVTVYASTKAANEAMIRSYAKAFGGKKPEFGFMAGTTANSVLVGLTETGGVQQYGQEEWEALQKFWIGEQVIPRLGQPDDVAEVVGFLCGREGRWITGSKISANGGSIMVL